jgi:DNA (cytosine-5)-methyltransferase 1
MAKVYRIRKLTPRECFRLMGVSDLDITKIQNYPLQTTDGEEFTAPDGLEMKDLKRLSISESQQYKLAGNSIVVQVLEGIFTQLFRADQDTLF